MNKLLLFGIIMLLLVSTASAETCFTALNVPINQPHYWKAVTYDDLLDNHLVSYGWLVSNDDVSLSDGIGPGYQFQMRIDKNCFDGRLLSNIESTGAMSSDIVVQSKGVDYATNNPSANKIYTLSLQDDDSSSVKQVGDISTGVVDGVDYLQLPDSFSQASSHAAFAAKKTLCDDSLLITEQLEVLKYDTWLELERVTTPISCSSANIIDCILDKGEGEDIHYATLVVAEARQCGIPSRVVKGISEGSFNGVDIKFDSEQVTYWLEFYDDGWKSYPLAESGAGVPSNIEQHCADNLDNDYDDLIDCWDTECDGSVACADWPSTKLYGTDLFTLNNPANIPYLELVNDFGGVIFNTSIDLRGVNVDQSLVITQNSLKLSDDAFNVPAQAQLGRLTLKEPLTILKDTNPCTDCNLVGYANGTAVFTIPGTGIYSLKGHVANATVTNETIIPVAGDGLLDKAKGVGDKVKALWGSLTTIGKIGIPALLFLIYLVYKRRQKNKWKRRFNNR